MSTSAESNEKKRLSTESKEKEDLDTAKVHSANSWETADLGDDERKKKFLRLMGASKADHHGRFVIGDKESTSKHSRDKKQTEKMEKELEEQYKHTFEHRITKWSHKGLGFDDEKKPESDDMKSESTGNNQSSEKPKDSVEAKESDSKSENQSSRKRESTETATKIEETPPKKPKMVMNFVKASQ